ncbi:MAG: YdcF family protein [Candidatus Pacearchaeota archaeon]
MLKRVYQPTERELNLAEIIWDYSKIGDQSWNKLQKADAIVWLASIDLLPAERAVELYKDKWAPYLVFTGGQGGRNFDKRRRDLDAVTEAEMGYDVALKMGVSREDQHILLEKESKNTGENIGSAKEKLFERGVSPELVIFSHMPSSLRRDLATVRKQWPEITPIMVCPEVAFEKYHQRGFQGQMSQVQLIADMLGDFQRMIVYSEEKYGFNYMAPQPDNIPGYVLEAYHELLDFNPEYQEHLVRKDREVLKI